MDLIIVAILSLLLTPLVLFTGGAARVVLGLVFILFFPGYAFISALFPRKHQLGGMERTGLSIGSSIAIAPLLGLILNYTPLGITVKTILFTLLAFILVMCLIARFRRRRLTAGERFRVSFRPDLSFWRGMGKTDRVLSVVLVAVILGAAGTMGFAIAAPKTGEFITEFYILGPEGKAEAYPRNMKTGERESIILAVVNNENRVMDYRVKVLMNGTEADVKIWQDTGRGVTGPIGNNAIDINSLANGERWESRLLLEPMKKGESQRVDFLLIDDKLREMHHFRTDLGNGSSIDIEIDEVKGEGSISFYGVTAIAGNSYRLEIRQGGSIAEELVLAPEGEETFQQDFTFPPGRSLFYLYENDNLAFEDIGAVHSLYLWVDVD